MSEREKLDQLKIEFKNYIDEALDFAFRLGHRAGHIQGEQFNKGLIDEYKQELLRQDERIREYEANSY